MFEFEAESDGITVVNLTNHAYWNLSGNLKESILKHELQMNADKIVEVDNKLIPTGKLVEVAREFDFQKPMEIGEHIKEIPHFGGYDHCFVLKNHKVGQLELAASVKLGKRKMEIYTTKPSLQLYTCNKIASTLARNGASFFEHSAFCLETQYIPDSPNNPSLSPPLNSVLRAGEKYCHKTVHKFYF